MKKISRKQLYNILLIAAAVIVLFTPVGTTVKVWLNRVMAFSPSEIPDGKRENIGSYRWDLQSIDGEIYDFNTARDRVVLVNFWATWCPPCIAEMPFLDELYKDYGDRVVFLFVTGEERDVVRRFLDKDNWNIPVYFPVSQVPEKLYSRTIPATWVIDKEGNLVMAKKGAADWNSDSVRAVLDRLLRE
ncbi:TlpA family protein disulfide reductase [Sinomicrobium soli]|uniref:TlpA family protein disulfide reductase n=1 Tax=Sinomicrobium sp. N-1-3-6 TaxID=2219864 RepID=UPI000DCEE9D5|nr:TlpA disulfide reductase family protein [Sinomicrobium sp. N-1-3-6]RAV27516.1 TlpA family protein disulfide reductase [Sinomicrobium sp. N-1-3-6]